MFTNDLVNPVRELTADGEFVQGEESTLLCTEDRSVRNKRPLLYTSVCQLYSIGGRGFGSNATEFPVKL